jgi:hypothetical protein
MKRWMVAVVFALSTLIGIAQTPAAGPTLMELMQALQFAELVRAAALSREQLSALAGLQARWLDGQQAPEAAAAAVLDVCLQVLKGKSTEEAVNGPDGIGQELRQVQEQIQTSSQTLAIELRELLKPEQRQALLAQQSPARMLAGLVQALRQARKAPQPEWEQMRQGLSGAMAGFAGPRGAPSAAGATPGELLDQARQMSDAEFERVAPTLAGDWARKLAPDMMRQVDDPATQDQRLLETCRRLVSDAQGHALLTRLLDASPAGAPAPVGVAAPAPAK